MKKHTIKFAVTAELQDDYINKDFFVESANKFISELEVGRVEVTGAEAKFVSTETKEVIVDESIKTLRTGWGK